VEECNVGVNYGETAGQTVLYDLGRSVGNRSSSESPSSTPAKVQKEEMGK
jgi:hypothetical protein